MEGERDEMKGQSEGRKKGGEREEGREGRNEYWSVKESKYKEEKAFHEI